MCTINGDYQSRNKAGVSKVAFFRMTQMENPQNAYNPAIHNTRGSPMLISNAPLSSPPPPLVDNLLIQQQILDTKLFSTLAFCSLFSIHWSKIFSESYRLLGCVPFCLFAASAYIASHRLNRKDTEMKLIRRSNFYWKFRNTAIFMFIVVLGLSSFIRKPAYMLEKLEINPSENWFFDRYFLEPMRILVATRLMSLWIISFFLPLPMTLHVVKQGIGAICVFAGGAMCRYGRKKFFLLSRFIVYIYSNSHNVMQDAIAVKCGIHRPY